MAIRVKLNKLRVFYSIYLGIVNVFIVAIVLLLKLLSSVDLISFLIAI